METSKSAIIHKRSTTYSDADIIISDVRLMTTAEHSLYGCFLLHTVSDISFGHWWINSTDEIDFASTVPVFRTNAVASFCSDQPEGVRPIIFFKCSDGFELRPWDTFVFHDTDFIVVDNGIAIARRCIGRATYRDASDLIKTWFDNRIDIPFLSGNRGNPLESPVAP